MATQLKTPFKFGPAICFNWAVKAVTDLTSAIAMCCNASACRAREGMSLGSTTTILSPTFNPLALPAETFKGEPVQVVTSNCGGMQVNWSSNQ